MIGDSLPQKGGRMYTLAKQFDSNDVPREGNDNWLSDANPTAPRKDKNLLEENRSKTTITDEVITSNTSTNQAQPSTFSSTGGESNTITPSSQDFASRYRIPTRDNT
jgi:hypothetical protein